MFSGVAPTLDSNSPISDGLWIAEECNSLANEDKLTSSPSLPSGSTLGGSAPVLGYFSSCLR